MTLNDYRPMPMQQPSRSRMRYVEALLRNDADAALREIAFVLAMTRRVKNDILSEKIETEPVGA